MTSPVDRFIAIDEELGRLDYDLHRFDQLVRFFDDLLPTGLILDDPQRVRNILLEHREKAQTAMNNRVVVLLSLETSR
jgi:hypothetical protein